MWAGRKVDHGCTIFLWIFRDSILAWRNEWDVRVRRMLYVFLGLVLVGFVVWRVVFRFPCRLRRKGVAESRGYLRRRWCSIVL